MVIANNNFEGQSFAAIVIGNAVGGVIIEGNEMEGIGGPAIIIFGMTNTITIKSNYIATTNEGRVTHGALWINKRHDSNCHGHRGTAGWQHGWQSALMLYIHECT